MAARSTIGAPVLMPPSMPPALLLRRHRASPCLWPRPYPRPPPHPDTRSRRAPGCRAARRREAQAELDALDGGHREDRLGQRALQAAVALHEAADAGRISPGDDLDDAAERVALCHGVVHGGAHLRARLRIGAAHRVGLDALDVVERHLGRALHAADRHDVAGDAAAKGAEQALRHGAHRYARRRLAGARALDDGPDVVEVVEQRAAEVCVPRPGTVIGSAASSPSGSASADSVRPQLAASRFEDGQGDRRARGLAVAHAADDLYAVLLDRHALTAAVAVLPPPELTVDRLARHRQPGRTPLEDRRERGTVRLACRQPSKRTHG